MLVSGYRLSADPLEEALLLGLEGERDEPLVTKKSDPDMSAMWFGPRLGRREKRSADEVQEDVIDGRLEEVLELLKDNPWTLVPLRGRCREWRSERPWGPAQSLAGSRNLIDS
jgi:hypothetical protein